MLKPQLAKQKATVENATEHLQEFRSAIIANTAAGKIDVRNISNPQAAIES